MQQQAPGVAAPGQPAAGAAQTPAQQAAALAALLPAAAGAGAAGARPPVLPIHPALAAMSPALPAGMLPLGAPGAAFFAARPPGQLQQPFFMPVPQQVAAAAAAAAAGDAAARRPASRPASRTSSGAAASKKYCNCKNSRCLKLYCECFASGRYCDGCNCINCYNNRDHEATRQAAVEAILERNPNAFRPKIAGGSDSRHAGGARHNKGCNCKKSGCLKKYCECFQAGIVCSDNCKCLDCKNYEGSEAREALISPQGERGLGGSPMTLRRGGRSGASPTAATGLLARPGFPSPGSGSTPALPALAALQAAAAAVPKPLTPDQKQQVAREAMKEVIKPQVVEKLAMLLMVVSQEEHDRRQGHSPAAAAAAPKQQQQQQQPQADGVGAMEVEPQPAAQQSAPQQAQQAGGGENGVQAAPAAAVKQEAGGPEAMQVDSAAGAPADQQAQQQQQQQQQAAGDGGGGSGSPAAGAAALDEWEAQERLVLSEFRDTLQMISRVVGEKVDKKCQALLLPPGSVAGLPPLGPAAGTPGAGLLGMAALPPLKPGQPAGQPGSGVLMAGTPGQQPQLVLLPPALMAQQMAAVAGGMGLALQQTPQGLQMVQRPLDTQGAAAGQQGTSPPNGAQ